MITRVYALIYDDKAQRALFNRKDGLLPLKLAAFKGLIGLFGGKIEENETPREGLIRELAEEIPDVSFDLTSAKSISVPLWQNEEAEVFYIPYDLSGDNKSAPSIHKIRVAVCMGGEGEPLLATYNWLEKQPAEAFAPGVYAICRNFLSR